MYRKTTGGAIRISDGAFIPECPDNKDWQAVQLWLSQGNTLLPEFVRPLTYREKRKRAYLGGNDLPGLGKDPRNFENHIGDVFDTVIAELAARGTAITPAFQTLLDRIAAIKTKYPPD